MNVKFGLCEKLECLKRNISTVCDGEDYPSPLDGEVPISPQKSVLGVLGGLTLKRLNTPATLMKEIDFVRKDSDAREIEVEREERAF